MSTLIEPKWAEKQDTLPHCARVTKNWVNDSKQQTITTMVTILEAVLASDNMGCKGYNINKDKKVRDKDHRMKSQRNIEKYWNAKTVSEKQKWKPFT